MASSPNVPRVMIWYQFRSRSTALELSMASVPSFKIFHDHLSLARISAESSDASNIIGPIPKIPGYSYKEVKTSYEADYPGKEAVIVKDAPVTLMNQYQYIPDGFKHVFLVRDPKEAIPSMWTVMESARDRGFLNYNPQEILFKYGSLEPVLNLYHHLVNDRGEVPIVIDSQDLVRNPRAILERLCGMTGLTFHRSMLKWKPGNIAHWPDLIKLAIIYESSVYGTAIESAEFYEAPSEPCEDDMDRPLKQMIETDTEMFREMTVHKL